MERKEIKRECVEYNTLPTKEICGVDQDCNQSIGRSLKSDVCYSVVDLLKLIVRKNEENDMMRQSMHVMWMENDRLRRINRVAAKIVPPSEVKVRDDVKILENEIAKLKGDARGATASNVQLGRKLECKSREVEEMDKKILERENELRALKEKFARKELTLSKSIEELKEDVENNDRTMSKLHEILKYKESAIEKLSDEIDQNCKTEDCL